MQKNIYVYLCFQITELNQTKKNYNMKNYKLLFFIFFIYNFLFSQNIALKDQFIGKIDFTMFGNTLNIVENESGTNCDILTTSTANLNLDSNSQILAAYLYWAGSGMGDTEIKLNNTTIIAESVFSNIYLSYNFFSCFANVTSQIQNTGNGNYTVSELDLTNVISEYCPNGINFGGWAIVIIYKNDLLAYSQINIYDGLELVSGTNPELTIQVSDLYVADNENAKIGFLAWEGDSALAVDETLTVNGIPVFNAINPIDNAFNSTNSFTGQTDLYNMDLDFYDVSNNVNIGDTFVEVKLTSGQDLVMINTVVTKLNTILPDATVILNTTEVLSCDSRMVQLNFEVHNYDSTSILPINTPISIYADSVLIGIYYTQNPIPINGYEIFDIEINIPDTIPNTFELIISADDIGTGIGIVSELDETNNQTTTTINLKYFENDFNLNNLISCNTGNYISVFNLNDIINQIDSILYSEILFFNSETDAFTNQNSITNPSEYYNQNNLETIYMRIQDVNSGCYTVTSFDLEIENCLPRIPEGFSPNGDGNNDTFYIQNLQNVFSDFEIYYYNRYGNLVYKGNNDSYQWNGEYNNKPAPEGTYFYILHLKDEQNITYKGWIYLNR